MLRNKYAHATFAPGSFKTQDAARPSQKAMLQVLLNPETPDVRNVEI